jgi:hypothetical protein
MGGGVHWAEWIVPWVGASHLAVDQALNAAGEGDKRVAVPGSSLDKSRDAQKLAETERAQAEAEQQDRARLAESQRVAGLPENVRKRAGATAKLLGESGKRETASQYLSGSL